MSENTFTHNSINVNPMHKITIVAARWNAELVDDLVHAASEHLTKIGYKNIETIYVPGSWELVHASQKALEKSDGVISFGVVIRGETTHYELDFRISSSRPDANKHRCKKTSCVGFNSYRKF